MMKVHQQKVGARACEMESVIKRWAQTVKNTALSPEQLQEFYVPWIQKQRLLEPKIKPKSLWKKFGNETGMNFPRHSLVETIYSL